VNRKKVWHIIRREYVESVRKKSFLFGLVATPLLMGDLTAWILLPEDFERTGIFEYHSESITNLTRLSNLESRLERLLVRHKAARFGMAEADVDALLVGVQLKTFQIGEEGGREASFDQVYFHAIALVMILFFALLPTGQILMRSVIEEKSSRVIEVLISSVMVGKIVGLGAVGLTLIGTWTAIGALIAARLGADFPIGGDDLAVFVLYFVPGYFFYAALLGSVGSICPAERDAQPVLTPISLTLILPVMLGFAIAQSPDHVLVRTASFVPFFTPSLMLFRFTIKQPPLWELGATWLSLVAGTAAMFWASSRIFRVGILLTGKRPTIPEIARWVWAR
jgi:ABC-2 type transport system permease protein